MNVKSLVKSLGTAAKKHSPELLTAIGIGGFFLAIGLAIKATPKALDMVTVAEDEKEDSLTPMETVKAVYKAYIPTAITAVASTACVLGASRINHVRNAELATAYALAQAYIKKTDEKTAEIVGEEKADQIKREVRNSPVRTIQNIPATKVTSDELFPYYDPLSNTPFYSSPKIMKEVEVNLNQRLFCSMETYITVADLYEELNRCGVQPKLKQTSVAPMLGWKQDAGGIKFEMNEEGVPIEMDHWDDGRPCYVMTFRRYHTPDYL